jgi:hypothetical protein
MGRPFGYSTLRANGALRFSGACTVARAHGQRGGTSPCDATRAIH